MLRFFWTSFSFLFFATFLSGCASNQSRTAEPARTPRFLELKEEQSIATVHFPAGIYSLDSSDNEGFYYRATRPVVEHSFAGPLPQRGGIFVSKGNRQLRGYIVWASGLTRIGHVPPGAIVFRD